MQTVGLTVVSNSTRRSNQRLADHGHHKPVANLRLDWWPGNGFVLSPQGRGFHNFVKGLHECAEKLRKSDVL